SQRVRISEPVEVRDREGRDLGRELVQRGPPLGHRLAGQIGPELRDRLAAGEPERRVRVREDRLEDDETPPGVRSSTGIAAAISPAGRSAPRSCPPTAATRATPPPASRGTR